MKVEYLIEYQFPEIKTRKVRKTPDHYFSGMVDSGVDAYIPQDSNVVMPRVMRNKKVRHFGTGTYASTYGHQDNPHDVRKVSREQQIKNYDGFWTFIVALSKHEDNDNPYFPRFRSITNYEGPRTGSYSVQVERLYHVNSLKSREVEALILTIYGMDNWKRIVLMISNDAMTLPDQAIGKTFLDALSNSFREVRYQELIIDKNLKSAIDFITLIPGGYLDIHPANIMVRNTPYGKQIVFSDPRA